MIDTYESELLLYLYYYLLPFLLLRKIYDYFWERLAQIMNINLLICLFTLLRDEPKDERGNVLQLIKR